jgi:nitrate/nitrite-specific signal transduction histidine kinase
LKTLGDGRIELRIEDNGVGFDPLAARPGHYGLVGLREQAESIAADLALESGSQGTVVCVRLRVEPARFVP